MAGSNGFSLVNAKSLAVIIFPAESLLAAPCSVRANFILRLGQALPGWVQFILGVGLARWGIYDSRGWNFFAVHLLGGIGQALCLPLPWTRRTASRHDVGGRQVA